MRHHVFISLKSLSFPPVNLMGAEGVLNFILFVQGSN